MRKLMWFTIGFGVGCGLCAYFYGQWILWGLIFSAVAALLSGIVTVRYRHSRYPTAIFLGLTAALGWFLIYNGIFLKDAVKLDGETTALEIRVDDYSYETDYGIGFDGSLELEGRNVRVLVYLNEKLELAPGDVVSGTFRCRFTTDGGSDTPLYHRSKGIFLILYQKGKVNVRTGVGTSVWQYPALWRQQLKEILNAAFPSDVSGFTRALLLGDRTGIDYETDTAFKISGISHIIAVSGLHISILFGLVQSLCGKRRLLTCILGGAAVILFAAVAGFTPSVTRAAIMQILFMIAMLFEKEYDSLTSLSFAALVMLIANPLVITAVGFQLSVACLAGICLFSEPLKKWMLEKRRFKGWKKRLFHWLAGSASITISTMVFTTPLVAVYFGTVSLVSVLTNLLTLWVVSFVFCSVIGVCLLWLILPKAAVFAGSLIAWPIRYILFVAKSLAALPLAAVYTTSVYIVAWLVFVYVLLAVFLCLRKKPVGLTVAATVIGLFAAIVLSWTEPMLDDFRLTVLDVGQGQAILLQSEGKTFLVDCGGDNSEEVSDIVAETLLSQGISRLDGVFLTHLDGDHSGGIPYLLTRIDADMVFLPYILGWEEFRDGLTENVQTEIVMEDTQILFGETSIQVFAPISYNSGNESSMCLLLQRGNCDILITGDMGETGERILLSNRELPQLDVLIVGHHGSKYSSCEALLAQTRPRYAMISVGENNSYGHPAQEVLERLSEYGCTVYRTDLNGTIIYRG